MERREVDAEWHPSDVLRADPDVNSCAENAELATTSSTRPVSLRLRTSAMAGKGSHAGTRGRRIASIRSCENSTIGTPRPLAHRASQPMLSLSLYLQNVGRDLLERRQHSAPGGEYPVIPAAGQAGAGETRSGTRPACGRDDRAVPAR
jgi:hypothetical protein